MGNGYDIWFQSAVNVATNAIDCIHTTAASHGRVFIVEIMGHKVGWLTLHAGIAGGADIILLPEIPYDINVVCDALKETFCSRQKVFYSGSCRGRDFKKKTRPFRKKN